MRFEHEFTVEVPLEQAWRSLSDAGAVAAALPDAELRAVDGVHTGRVRLDAGRNLACEATVTTVDQDEDDHVASVAVHGRQVDGPGIGSALLRSRLRGRDASTTISLTAEVLTAGHDPGNDFQDAARRIFEAVAEGMGRHARERPPVVERPSAPGPAVETPPVTAPASAPAVRQRSGLDSQKGLIGGTAGLLIAAVVLRGLRRRRRI